MLHKRNDTPGQARKTQMKSVNHAMQNAKANEKIISRIRALNP
jgi:hypothetical protein